MIYNTIILKKTIPRRLSAIFVDDTPQNGQEQFRGKFVRDAVAP